MLKSLTVALAVILVVLVQTSSAANSTYTLVTVATGYTIPWEIKEGPDGWLWATERIGYCTRTNLETGERDTILDLHDKVLLVKETGMLGFCFHPNFADTPWVYVSWIGGTEEYPVRVVERYIYEQNVLTNPMEVFRLEPAATMHQGTRLFIDDNRKLWITGGDMPRTWLALEDDVIEGKIHRVNLDGSVPADNPVPGNSMWSKGHRNVQGFVILPNGNIWASEHGNAIEDEINFIVKGGNYGWPMVEGPCDEDDEIEYCDSANVLPPRWSTGDVTWAPGGMDYYNADRFAELKNCLIQVYLKGSMMQFLKLNDEGTEIQSHFELFSNSVGRIRDIAVTKDGRIFVCTSNKEAMGQPPFPLSHDDRILELVSIPDTTPAEFIIPDTVFISATPGFTRRVDVPVINTGTGTIHINYVWNLIHPTADILHSIQWLFPVHVLPLDTTYIPLEFAPPDTGRYIQTIRIGYGEGQSDSVVLVGTTNSGVATPVADTVELYFSGYKDTTVRLPFIVVGSAPVSVTGTFVHNTQRKVNIHVTEVDTGSFIPGDTIWVSAVLQFQDTARSSAKVSLITDSYTSPPVTVITRLNPSGVYEYQPAHALLTVYPNPFSESLNVLIPDEFRGGTLTISSLSGKQLYSTTVYSGAVELPFTGGTLGSVLPGAYAIRITSHHGVASTVVIKY